MFDKLKAKAQGLFSRVKGMFVVGTATAALTCVTAFAADTSTPLPTIAITTDMLLPLVEGVIANIGVILPVGIGLFSIFLGIKIVPGLISRFLHM